MSTSTQEISRSGITSYRSRQTHLWLSGFLLLGTLPGVLGPLLIGWDYHLEADPRLLGLHAFALNAGSLAGLFVRGPMKYFALLCAAAFAALAFAGPPTPVISRLLVLSALGLAMGAMSARLGAAIGPALHAAPAYVASIGGVYFGAGALVAALLLDAGYSFAQPELGPALLSTLPLLYLVLTRKHSQEAPPAVPRDRNVRPIATSLLSLLLFFQIGNEWVIAVWLPFFLTHRLGASPPVAISLLAVHFVFLLFGRWLAKALLPILNHRRFLLAGIALSIVGYVLLATALTLPTATTAVILIGLALGPVLPVATEKLDRNLSGASVRRILLAAMAGASFEPFLAGFVAAGYGAPNIMFVPAVGAIAVCVIALLMMLESRLMGGSEIAH